jgi:hypothetical protein
MSDTAKLLKILIEKNTGYYIRNFDWVEDFEFSCEVVDRYGKLLWSKKYDLRKLQARDEFIDIREKELRLKNRLIKLCDG